MLADQVQREGVGAGDGGQLQLHYQQPPNLAPLQGTLHLQGSVDQLHSSSQTACILLCWNSETFCGG